MHLFQCIVAGLIIFGILMIIWVAGAKEEPEFDERDIYHK